jgi:hypothetical protein
MTLRWAALWGLTAALALSARPAAQAPGGAAGGVHTLKVQGNV